MSLKVDKVQLEIIMKSDTTRAEIIKLEDEAKSLQKEMKKLSKNPEELAKASAEYDKVKNRISELRKEIGITGMTMRELQQRQKELNMMMRSMDPRTEKYAEYRKELTQVNARMRELRGSGQAAESAFSKIAGGFNKFGFMVTSLLASITGLSLTFRKLAEDVAKMDDVYADVMKTTGLTRDAVLELNEEFKKMDTRTSREDLNKIAEAGGRIGVAKEDIIDFTEAMNIANVALGDSFTGGVEEISTKLGKLKNLFSETKDMQIEKAYLSIASSINELGANGAASEQNISEFALRIGSLPEALKPSVAETLALGAAFEESGIEAEISGRAYNIFLKQASTESGKFAQVMGISAKEVENLINTNPMDFFLKFAEGMRGMDATEVAKTLDYLGVNADGANKAIGAAANSTDRFRELITLSNKAFTEGTSVINEYNIKNNNLAAQLDKARKNFKEVSLELGQSLNPLLLKSTNATSYLIKALVELPKWIKQNAVVIASLVTAWTVYGVAVNASIILDKLKVFWTDKVTFSVKKMAAAIKANPWGLIATGVILGVAFLNKFLNKQDEVNKAQEKFLDLAQKTSELYAGTQSLMDRFNARSGLNRTQLETLSSDLSSQLDAIEKNDADIKTRAKKAMESDQQYQELLNKFKTAKTEQEKQMLLAPIRWREQAILGELSEQFDKNKKMVDQIKKQKNDVDNLLKNMPTASGGLNSITGGSATGASTENKAMQKDIDQAEDNAKQQEIIFLTMLKKMIINEEQYNIISERLSLDLLNKKKDILKQYGQDTKDIQKQILESEIKQSDLSGKIKPGKLQGLSVEGVDMDEVSKGLSLYMDYLQKKKDADIQYDDWKKELQQKNLERLTTAADVTVAITEGAVNAVMTLHQMEADDLEIQKQKELAAAGDNAAAREAIEKEYALKEFELKKKQANSDMAIKIAQAIANGFQAVASIWAVHAPNPILAAALTIPAVATVAFQVAALKKQRDVIMASTFNGGSTEALPTGSLVPNSQIPVTTQAAEGRWDVIGADDRRTYRNVPYRGIARTGIVSRPTLMGERGDELIIDNPTLRNIRMNAPHLISEVQRFRVRQRASGKWDADSGQSGEGSSASIYAQVILDENTKIMQEVSSLLRWLKENRIEAYTVLSDFEKKRDLRDKSVRKGSL